MRVTYFGGPRDGATEEVNPRTETGIRQVLIYEHINPATEPSSIDPNKPTVTKEYKLDVKTAKFVWQELKWPLT
jgi:hypothetical protein